MYAFSVSSAPALASDLAFRYKQFSTRCGARRGLGKLRIDEKGSEAGGHCDIPAEESHKGRGAIDKRALQEDLEERESAEEEVAVLGEKMNRQSSQRTNLDGGKGADVFGNCYLLQVTLETCFLAQEILQHDY